MAVQEIESHTRIVTWEKKEKGKRKRDQQRGQRIEANKVYYMFTPNICDSPKLTLFFPSGEGAKT